MPSKWLRIIAAERTGFSSQPIERAAVLGAVKARPGNAAGALRPECRPALTPPARGGCKIWRSGRKNARGAGQTKELTKADAPASYPAPEAGQSRRVTSILPPFRRGPG
jgi:hypothetical protein